MFTLYLIWLQKRVTKKFFLLPHLKSIWLCFECFFIKNKDKTKFKTICENKYQRIIFYKKGFFKLCQLQKNPI